MKNQRRLGRRSIKRGLMMSYKTILMEVKDRIAVITLNRPEVLNAWNSQMAVELSDAFSVCDKTDDVRAAQRLGAGRFIKKPYTLENLGEAIREELEK